MTHVVSNMASFSNHNSPVSISQAGSLADRKIVNLKPYIDQAASRSFSHIDFEKRLWIANALFIIPIIIYPILSLLGHALICLEENKIDILNKELSQKSKFFKASSDGRTLILTPEYLKEILEKHITTFEEEAARRDADDCSDHQKHYIHVYRDLENVVKKGINSTEYLFIYD